MSGTRTMDTGILDRSVSPELRKIVRTLKIHIMVRHLLVVLMMAELLDYQPKFLHLHDLIWIDPSTRTGSMLIRYLDSSPYSLVPCFSDFYRISRIITMLDINSN